MKLGIMQPYFFPYIGYFQLISEVDVFIIYDNIKYTKKGWINRNRILQNGKDVMFSLPLKKDTDSLDVCQRELAQEFNRDKLLNQIKGAYRSAPFFTQTFPLIELVILYDEANLFRFLHHSIIKICEHLGITTRVNTSSSIAIDHELKSQDKVLALTESVGASTYVNPIGGRELYSREAFREKGVLLEFIQSRPFTYVQFGDEFVPWLSIIDLLMFSSLDTAKFCVSTNYELI